MRFCLLTLMLALANISFAQRYQDYLSSGDQLAAEGDYYSAAQYYKKAFLLDTTRLSALESYAACCRLFFNYGEALKAYDRLVRADARGKHADALFWRALMKKSKGDYTAAAADFENFNRKGPDAGNDLRSRAVAEAEYCRWAGQAIKDSLPYSIEHLGRNINTSYSDFGATMLHDSLLLFSSLRLRGDEDYETLPEGAYLTELYQAFITPAGLSKPESVGRLNQQGIHNANICCSADGKTFFFTRCPDVRKPDLPCEIWMVRIRNGKWQKPVPVEGEVNKPGYSSTQPAMAGTDKGEVLYFVSDRPGGYGRKDIWYSTFRRNKFSDPVNLGPVINTPGDEITPFIDHNHNTLYFSSDWHRGFGGFDIFSSNGGLNQWSTPHHLGYPLNTGYNDLYFTKNRGDSSGYLTSNRPGSFFIKSQTCCNDIYRWNYIKPPERTELTEVKDTTPIPDRIEKLLPLTLYFHNDIPDPGSKKDRTKVNYQTTVAGYFMLLDRYKSEYARGLKEEEKGRAMQDMDAFFLDHVNEGLNKLNEFTALLLEDLRQGSQVRVTLKGYTSPLTTAEYNKNLAKRRISSLENYFFEFGDGALLPFINTTAANGGRMEIVEEPIGEEQASKEVSDNPNDARNSVYSIAAARERRIQILYYESKDTVQEVVPLPPKPTTVKFAEEFFNFGEVPEGAIRNAVFTFENTGPNPLRIIALETSCGCTLAEWPKKEILPGEKSKISVSFNAHNLQGEQTESIVLKGNVPGGEKVLFFRAVVK